MRRTEVAQGKDTSRCRRHTGARPAGRMPELWDGRASERILTALQEQVAGMTHATAGAV